MSPERKQFDPIWEAEPVLRGFAAQAALGWEAGGFSRIEGAVGVLEPLMVAFCGERAGTAKRWMIKVDRVRETSRRMHRETIETRVVKALIDYIEKHALPDIHG